jgi:acyl phosphate:glycerol-3-phosphate acyltransferase
LREFILILAAYLVGSIPMAYLVVKWRFGKDIRKYGSGGVGASNVFQNFSKTLGALIFIFDVGKGTLMVWAAQISGLELAWQIAVGVGVIAGHNWPVFLKFNAGRGLATSVGVAFYLFPWGLWVFVIGAACIILIGSSPLPVLIGLAALPLASWIHKEPIQLTLGLLIIFSILVFRRLTAPKTDRSASVSTRELLLNRLLFDRDIRDGKTWMKHIALHKPKK